MTFQDWITEEETRRKKFIKFWIDEHFKDPKTFPMEMEAGEWDEQYQLFLDKE